MITVTFDKQKASQVASKAKKVGIYTIAGLWQIAQQSYEVGKVVSKEIGNELKKK